VYLLEVILIASSLFQSRIRIDRITEGLQKVSNRILSNILKIMVSSVKPFFEKYVINKFILFFQKPILDEKTCEETDQ
jgi:hypothetical protein